MLWFKFFSLLRRDCLSSKTNPFYKRAQDIKICQFNQSHHVHKAEMETHLQSCEAARRFKDIAQLGEEVKKHVNLVTKVTGAADEKKAPLNNPEATGSEEKEEDWDKEMEGKKVLSYDPMRKVLERNFAVNSACRSEEERRDIRAMQRLGDTEGLSYLLADRGARDEEIGGKKGKKKKRSSKSKAALPVGMSMV